MGRKGGKVSVQPKDQTPLLSLSGTRKFVRTSTNLVEETVTAEVQFQASLKRSLSWKKQFSASHRNFEHYTPRDGLQRMCLYG
jgi:hypothetical protein